MKRIFLIALIFIFLISGCRSADTKEEAEAVKGIWFSYNEIDKMLLSDNFEIELIKAADNCELLGITDVFIHLIPYCDAYYPSEIYPSRSDSGVDILELALRVFHQRNIRVHGWINPYRVRTADSDKDKLPNKSPVNTLSEQSICIYNGIYLNPSAYDCIKLITDGIKEILSNYNIDGIHFDDYFYPTADQEFDKSSYEEYVKNTEMPMSLNEWRIANVNMLISSCKRIIKTNNPDCIFSISPAASIENNYSKLSADVEGWIENDYVDWIIPQLYFGFDYPDKSFCFDRLLKDWKTVAEKGKAKLIIGLASYKIGTDSAIESNEWSKGNMMSLQTDISLKETDGCCYFSYSSLFGSEELHIKERENLLKTVSQQ